MNNHKEKWIELIRQSKPNVFLTITFKDTYELNDRASYIILNRILHYVNSELFGKNYKAKKRFLFGIGCCEYQINGSPHYHLLINGNNQIFSDIRYSFIKKLKKISQLSINGFDIQEIINEEKVASYITKTINHQKKFDKIFPLGRDGAYCAT